jgi:hypothetical protein
MRTVLACDPGSYKSAFIVWDGRTVRNSGIVENGALQELLKSGDLAPYDFAAIERMANMGQRVGEEVLATVWWSGRFYEALSRKTEVTRPYRTAIKKHLGCGRGKDKDVRAALIEKWGEVGTKSNRGPLWGVSSHIWAALAVGDYALAHDAQEAFSP